MGRKTDNKIIVVVRKTRLEELIARFNTVEQARFYVEHLGADFTDYQQEHDTYQQSLAEVKNQLDALGLVQVLDRAFLPNFIFGDRDTVVVVGQDGLVANTMKYLDGQPVVAVNPDPARWEGVLLPFEPRDVSVVAEDVFARRRTHSEITMAHVRLNNGQQLYGVNDLFIGPKSHTSIRYQIQVGGQREQQSSSGIIVSTGLGSTGWFKSILTGANGISAACGRPLGMEGVEDFRWESRFLYFTVREPWPSKFSQAGLVFGRITEKEPMTVVSQIPERGVIFSDGIEDDYLEFNSGTRAEVGVADKKGLLVV